MVLIFFPSRPRPAHSSLQAGPTRQPTDEGSGENNSQESPSCEVPSSQECLHIKVQSYLK